MGACNREAGLPGLPKAVISLWALHQHFLFSVALVSQACSYLGVGSFHPLEGVSGDSDALSAGGENNWKTLPCPSGQHWHPAPAEGSTELLFPPHCPLQRARLGTPSLLLSR